MKFKVNRKELYQAIQNIIGAVPTKTTLPILSNILFSLQENKLTLTGTDLEVSISTNLEVQEAENGTVAVPAKVLFEIMRELPDIPVQFNCDDEFKIAIETEKGFYKLSGEPKDEFPQISIKDTDNYFEMNSDKLGRMIEKTLFAVSTDELRTALMGVLLRVSENEMRMVATDGHRMVRIIDTNFTWSNAANSTIIPTKALNLLGKNLPLNTLITINLGEDHIVFNFNETVIFCKSLEGQFPNYERVIPIENDKKMIINRDLFISSVKRVSIFSNSITHQIRLSVRPSYLEILSEDVEFGGEAREKIDIQYDGEDIDIGYNAAYLLDILRHLNSDDVEMNLKDPVSAGVLYPVEKETGEDILMLLMPIRLNDD